MTPAISCGPGCRSRLALEAVSAGASDEVGGQPWFQHGLVADLPMNDFLRRWIVVLWTIVIVLLLFWVLGMATSNTMSGYIHVFYALAILAAVFRIITKRGVV